MNQRFLFIFLSIFFLIACVSSYYDMNELQLGCYLVDASITDCNKVSKISDDNEVYYEQNFDISFKQNGVVYEHSFSNEKINEQFTVGDTIQVYVDKNNTDNVYLTPDSTKIMLGHVIPLIFLLLACSFIIVGIFIKEIEED